MLPKRTLALLALLLAAVQPCFAQSADSAADDGEADADPQRKQYRVELIVFEYLGPDSSAGEAFGSLVVSDYFPSEPFDIERYNRVNEMVSYTDMKHLSDATERLGDDEQYRLMERIAWTQPLLKKGEAIDIDIGRQAADTLRTLEGGRSPLPMSGVSGTVRVYGDFHLFVELDIKARLERQPDPAQDEAPAAQTDEDGFTSILGAGTPASRQAAPRFDTYHIVERRRVKLEEYHYFDHPYLGAIVTVWRHEDDSALR